MSEIVVSARSLPVIAEADLVVAGATFGGIAVACRVAEAGHRVVVIEPRTYPGYEVSALYRPWMPERAAADPPASMAPWLTKAMASTAHDGEVALHPDLMKRGLEDVLSAAGVKLLYASHPVGLIYDGSDPAGIVIGNKSGRQAILARGIVDTTDWGLLARLAGFQTPVPSCPLAIRVKRTLEFTQVQGPLSGTLEAPANIGIVNNAVKVHQGFLGAEHVLLEVEMELPLPSADHGGRMMMEIEARKRSLALAAHLIQKHPAFNNAWFAHTSPELTFASPYQVPSQDTARRLFVLSSAVVPVTGGDPAMQLEPVTAALTGEELARAVVKALQSTGRPAVDRCVARCGTPVDRQATESDVRELEAPGRGRTYRRVKLPAEAVPSTASVDILVAGGGTSGATAAAVAAESGVKTILLEISSGLGGTGTLGGIDSYWFGRRVGFTAEVDRRYTAVAEQIRAPTTGQWNVEGKMHALLDWVTEVSGEVAFRCCVVGAIMDGHRVKGTLVATPDGLRTISAKVIIDASGDGDVAVMAGAQHVYGSSRDRLPMWYSLAPFVKPGKPQNNFTSTVDISNVEDYTRAILAGRRRWDGHDHATYLAPRETRHILGDVVLNLTDQLLLRRFPDVINICFANCDIKGKSSSDWVVWGLLPPNTEAEIPYRALVPTGVDGLLVAGKAYSCTHDYLATARMQADMQNQGGACALAAVAAVRNGLNPRHVNVAQVQQQLVAAGVLPADVVSRRIDESPLSEAELQKLVDNLTGDEPFYLKQGFHDKVDAPSILILLGTAGERIVPMLQQAHAGATGNRRLLLARLLGWYGSPDAVPTLIEAIQAELAQGTLPPKSRKVSFAGIPPDHGLMPEACYLLYTLGMTRDLRAISVLEQVASLFSATLDDYRDKAKGPFYYVDAVAYVAERLGSPQAVPVLKTLHAKDHLHQMTATGPEPDFILERLAYLELALGRAMARCGAKDGYEILINYLADARALLADHAQDELGVFSGKDFGKDFKAWRQWLEGQSHLAPHPWRGRID